LPESLGQLAALQKLDLSGCKRMRMHGYAPHEKGALHVKQNGKEILLQNYRCTMLALVLAMRRGKKLWLPSELLEMVLEAIRGNGPGTA